MINVNCLIFVRPELRPMPSRAGESRGLTVADVAAQTEQSIRRTQRMFARWAGRGWPRVYSERSRRGKPTLYVDRAEFEAMHRGELTESRAA